MKFTYPSELPVSAARDDIAKAVSSSQVVIVSGQTGSGKTTQLPKILLELGRGTHGRQIVHTQPRRLAARTVAERIASEMGVHLGDEIGYQVRFTDETSPKTRLRVVTDGILVRLQKGERVTAAAGAVFALATVIRKLVNPDIPAGWASSRCVADSRRLREVVDNRTRQAAAHDPTQRLNGS